LILLVPVVTLYFLEITAKIFRAKHKIIRSHEKECLSQKLLLLVSGSLIFLVSLFALRSRIENVYSRNWSQFLDTFSLVGGIEPYRQQISVALIYLLFGLFFANLAVLKLRSHFDLALKLFRTNSYLTVMGLGALLVALMVSHYSETITDGGTYYAMKLSYSAAIIAFVASVYFDGYMLQILLGMLGVIIISNMIQNKVVTKRVRQENLNTQNQIREHIGDIAFDKLIQAQQEHYQAYFKFDEEIHDHDEHNHDEHDHDEAVHIEDAQIENNDETKDFTDEEPTKK
jgi:hypothetical protein